MPSDYIENDRLRLMYSDYAQFGNNPPVQIDVLDEVEIAAELRLDQVRVLRLLTLAGALQRESSAIQVGLEVEENGPYHRNFQTLDPNTHDYTSDGFRVNVWWFYTFRDGVSTYHTTVGTTTIDPWNADLYLVGDRLELRAIEQPVERVRDPLEQEIDWRGLGLRYEER